MKKRNAVFAGCDLSDKSSEICVLDGDGAVVETRTARTTRHGLVAAFRKYGHVVVAIEAGTHSRWVEEVLVGAGHKVIVANPRQVQLIWGRGKKTDRSDAMLLARLARVDPMLLAPVHHRSRAAQLDLASLRSRDILVSARTKLVNHVRGLLKQFGVRVERCSTGAFANRADEVVPPDLAPALGPVLEALRTLNAQIVVHDRQVDQLVSASPVAMRLAEVDGVGPVTALAYQLTIEDPTKFRHSRVVGSFVGLTPAKDQSGDSDPQKHISKAGNAFLRRLLVQCAHRVLGTFGRECNLRRWGLALCARGGPAGKKRAIVAVARKLAVILHRVWITGEPYDPNFGALAA
jgi:transposase